MDTSFSLYEPRRGSKFEVYAAAAVGAEQTSPGCHAPSRALRKQKREVRKDTSFSLYEPRRGLKYEVYAAAAVGAELTSPKSWYYRKMIRGICMEIRRAVSSDIDRIMDIYGYARKYMAEHGNPTQWSANYPDEEIIRADIEKQQLYLCMENDTVEGVFVFFIGDEPNYKVIKDGKWRSDTAYGVIHRVAASGRVHGITKACFEYAKDRAGYLRIDTHRDNKTMQSAIQKNGFKRCGIINVTNGSERIAFDYISEDITTEELKKWDTDSYIALDIRDSSSFGYGHLPNAVNIPADELTDRLDELDKNKKIVVYCMKGEISIDARAYLSENGFFAYNLEGGYGKWLIQTMEEDDDKPDCAAIELSIRKKFHKQIFSKFTKAINEYQLLKEGDKVAVCISGGKDSMLMAKLFQELQRHRKFNFELVFLVMDPGYNKTNRKVIENNAKHMNIPITVFETNIFEAVYEIEKSPCYLCARMRRGYLYSKAKELGCNKIALGHHYDDVIETIFMGMMYGSQIQTMMPKLHSTNFEGMELIRPLYLIREDDIKHWRDYNKLHFIQCACRFTDTCTTCNKDGSSQSKRMETKKIIAELKKINPFIESNIFKSVENVNLSTIIAYKQNGVKHHFLDDYDS